MKSKIIFGIFILIFLAISCITEYDAELPSSDIHILTIDGSIMEDTVVIFHLSKSFRLDSKTIPDDSYVNNADISIIGSNGYKSQPAINQGKGNYSMSIGKLDGNVEYGVQIEYDGDIYQSTLSKPLITPEIDSVSWIQPEKGGTVFFRVSTHDDSAGSRFFMWNYAEDWEFFVLYPTTIFYNLVTDRFDTIIVETPPNYYCWKSYVSNQYIVGTTESLSENKIINKLLYQHGFESDHFSLLYSVIVYQKAISKAAYEYYQFIVKYNEEMGGLFTPQPSELFGNVTCVTDPSKKVIGYVEVVKNVTKKRIFIQPSQLTYPTIGYPCNTMSHDAVVSYLTENRLGYKDFYESGYRPAGNVDQEKLPLIVPAEWAMSTCTDCIAKGGTKNKPGFWPNDHQ